MELNIANNENDVNILNKDNNVNEIQNDNTALSFKHGVESNIIDVTQINTVFEKEKDNTINVKPKKLRKKIIIASDSEDEELHEPALDVILNVDEEDTNIFDKKKFNKSKRNLIVDSDSENENQSVTEIESKIENNSKVFTTNYKGELMEDKEVDYKSRLATLCDPETSSDEEHVSKDLDNQQDISNEEITIPKNVKEAMELRKEIHSESQRMLREKQVSLPYHVPKARTLKEFLSKRPKFAISVFNNSTRNRPAKGIKMSQLELEIVSKKLEEREKEIQDFYKSDSESDDENNSIPNTGNQNLSEQESKNAEDNVVLVEHNVDTNKDSGIEKCTEEISTNKEMPSFNKLNSNEKSYEENKKETDKNDTQDTSGELQFHLEDNDSDDEEEHIPQDQTKKNTVINDEKLDDLIQIYNPSDLLQNETNCIHVNKKNTKLELLKEKLGNCKPRLSGGPDQVIDLDDGIAKPSAVSELMERFMKHVVKKPPAKHVYEFSVLNVKEGEVHKEIITLNVDHEDVSVSEEKPGAKLKKLRTELQNQMAQKRSALWQQKAINKKNNEKLQENEDDILDDEEEEILDDEEDEEEMSGDILLESEDELNDEIKEHDTESNVDGNVSENDDDIENFENYKKKELKRITRGFEDSDDEDTCQQIANCTKKSDGDDISPNRPGVYLTPIKHTQGKSDLSFLTPVDCLTGLKGFNSDSTFLHDSPVIPLIPTPLETSQVKISLTQSQRISKALFNETKTREMIDVMDELANLCSGNFVTQTSQSDNINNHKNQTFNKSFSLSNIENDEKKLEMNIENLEDLCSGKFPSQSLDSNITQDEVRIIYNDDQLNNTVSLDKSYIQINTQNDIESLNIDDNEERLITELLDEEEMENFKKKFDSPQKSQEVIESGGGIIYDSSDDENNVTQIRKKTQLKKLDFSDEESDNESNLTDEIIDLQQDDEFNNVDYDSEENEIDANVLQQKKGIKISDFVEKEAELSESEWGSEDEDEKEPNIYVAELGDKDKFDEEALRQDIERIHMRTLLDQDNREVKLLQELLLEDGELHGTGRQRQFKWKNIDASIGGDDTKNEDDEELYDESEPNEELIKLRRERQKFLNNAKERLEETNLLKGSSNILKLGQKVTKYIPNLSENKDNVTEDRPGSTSTNVIKTYVHQRGSFLKRNDQVLQRIAEFTKANSSVGNTRNTKNFVFQAVDIETTESKKRKASEGTPKVLKKLRYSSKTNELSDL